MALTVHQTYLTQNDCYRSGGALTPQGLMLHSVGCAQPDAMAFVQSWTQPGVKACVHGFIDATTGAVYQTLPLSLDPLGDGVILSHREGHQRGIATNHGDPEHLWSPFGLTMDIFRQAVSAALTGQAAAPASPAVPFLGRVTADALHIRSGPGTNCPIVGTIRDQGVYTIVETADGQGDSQWGKLKSGAGWIALDYVTPQ